MSDQLPRKRIEPLAPPPGQFDLVLGRARYRRHRRAMAMLSVAFVFVAGLGGGLALGRDVPRNLIDAAGRVVERAQPSPQPTPPASTLASKSPKAKDPQKRGQSTTQVQQPPPEGQLAYRGQAVGPAGQAASGLYVYVGVPTATGFEPLGWSVTRTDSQGMFSLACPHSPILLAPWPLRGDAKSKARFVSWSATFVGGATDPKVANDAPCTRRNKVDVTTIGQGSAIEGQVTMPRECKDDVISMRIWLQNDPLTYVKVQDLTDGEAFRVSGLPAGAHTLDAKGNRTTVLIGGGQVVKQDVWFDCEEGPVWPTGPAPTTTTTPSPTDTGTPEPTESQSTGTNSAEPDPTSSVTP